MSRQQPTPEKRKRYLSRVYFGVSDNKLDDVNPFDNMDGFLDAALSKMNFGTGKFRAYAKLRFAYNFNKVLDSQRVILKIEDILEAMQNEDARNIEIVEQWDTKAVFLL